MKTEGVSYTRLRGRYPALFISYCLDDGRAARFFPQSCRDEKALLERAKRAAGKGMDKAVLGNLRRYHQEAEAPRESMAALEKLASGAALVITGQQPCVGWGPLYNFYKAQTAIRYAQGIEGRGVPCVAAFWNHSDDSRGGRSPALPDLENRVRAVPLPAEERGTPCYEAGTDESLRMFALALGEALPRTEFSPWVQELITGTHRGSVAETFARLLFKVLGPFGLVVLEPRHLEGERSEKFFAGHLADPERLSRAVEAGRRSVIAEGFEDHLGRDVGLDLFEIRGSRRLRVEPGAAPKGRLSAGVALRALLQDEVLPTCACVGGPGEVGYLAELSEAYRAFHTEPAVVIPRATATLVEPKIARVIEKFGLHAEDLFGDDAALAARLPAAGPDLPGRIRALPERWQEDVDALIREMETNSGIARARERTSVKLREALAALAGRVERELERRDTSARGQHAKLVSHLRPEGKLQERVFTPLYYFSLFGPDLPAQLLGTLDPFVLSHQLITIRPAQKGG